MRLRSIQHRKSQLGFTLVEIMACMAIMAIVSGMVLVQNQTVNDTERLDRAADEIVAALRYARIEAMGNASTIAGTTQPQYAFGVAFDTTANTVTVYKTSYNVSAWTLPGTAVGCTMYPTQTYVINFATQPEVQGVAISSVHLTGAH